MRNAFVVGSLVTLGLIACGSSSDVSGGGGTSGGSTTANTQRSLVAEKKTGIATFYDADGSGNCSFDASPNDLDVAAMDKDEYNASASCGACLAVTGPKGNVTIRVVDSCPGCSDNGVNLDLSASAFAKIATPSDGRINITYQLVSCSVTGNVKYHFKDESSKYWTAIQIRNHKLPITKLEYDKGGGSFVEMKRADYNYFIADSGVGDEASNLTLRVTASDGQVIQDTLTSGIVADSTVVGSSSFSEVESDSRDSMTA